MQRMCAPFHIAHVSLPRQTLGRCFRANFGISQAAQQENMEGGSGAVTDLAPSCAC
jgi:hypothetical protein